MPFFGWLHAICSASCQVLGPVSARCLQQGIVTWQNGVLFGELRSPPAFCTHLVHLASCHLLAGCVLHTAFAQYLGTFWSTSDASRGCKSLAPVRHHATFWLLFLTWKPTSFLPRASVQHHTSKSTHSRHCLSTWLVAKTHDISKCDILDFKCGLSYCAFFLVTAISAIFSLTLDSLVLVISDISLPSFFPSLVLGLFFPSCYHFSPRQVSPTHLQILTMQPQQQN